ncbi:MAG: hypothetical protein JSW21_03665 [Gammaproteobacteria bacterium]|nr:MAG: hypothetical protein JSW21_03665 [Gammaproteobacteria bacterium]
MTRPHQQQHPLVLIAGRSMDIGEYAQIAFLPAGQQIRTGVLVVLGMSHAGL